MNELLRAFFAECGLKLVGFKLEFDRLTSDPLGIVSADEIRPDGRRLWHLQAGGKMVKDRFLRDFGRVMEAYEEVPGREKGILG